jgi:hypothetical protein
MSALSRRSFAESLALAALAPMIGVQADTISLAQWGAAAPAPAGNEPAALAKALAEVIRQQYGSRLSAEALSTITNQIQTGLEKIDRLRKVEIANGDEPDFVFSAVRSPGTR